MAVLFVQVVSDDPVDCMDQPSVGLAIHGLLRPAFIEEHSVIQKQIYDPEPSDVDTDHIAQEQLLEGVVQINGHRHEKELAEDNPSLTEDSDKDESSGNGFAFYKIEMIKIQLVSAQGNQVNIHMFICFISHESLLLIALDFIFIFLYS